MCLNPLIDIFYETGFLIFNFFWGEERGVYKKGGFKFEEEGCSRKDLNCKCGDDVCLNEMYMFAKGSKLSSSKHFGLSVVGL